MDFRKILAVLTMIGLVGSSAVGAEPPANQAKADKTALEFFESKVRPILAEQCYSCHGPKKQMGGGLRLDSSAGMLKGGDGGPAIVPGKPEQSPMIRAIHHAGDVKMPPKAKLPADSIEVLTAWVKMGAPWPADSTATRPADDLFEIGKKHWAFQPVKQPAIPPLAGFAQPQNPIDAFILTKLKAAGLTPAPAADRRTLVRRLSFDLIGLPPTPEEMEAALNDRSPEWYARLVEKLLASPQFGERWARHWLDVARYADTKGYVFTEERRFPFSYTYRDYVIRAFNEDLPYDRFVMEQLAADQLDRAKPANGDHRYLAAMGYLTLGRRFLNNVHDIIDDRIDVTMRGFQGLTVTCARCHDHKFDPIPTKDYYSLYGIFQASIEPKDLPQIGEPQQTEAYLAYEKELQAREARFRETGQAKLDQLMKHYRLHVGDYLIAVRNADRLLGEEVNEELPAGELNSEITRRWKMYLAETKKRHHPVWAPWHAFAALPQKEFADKAPALAERFAANADPQKRLHPLVAKMFDGKRPQTLPEIAQWYGELFKEVESLPAKPQVDEDWEALRKVLLDPKSPTVLKLDGIDFNLFFDPDTRNQLVKLKKKVDEWKATSAAAPPRAMVLNDVPNPPQTHVLVRGNPNNRGEAVPRQYLRILGTDATPRAAFKNGSGRLELAQAIASKDNPLTARVMVNRIWLNHFGQGIVRTPSDFGLRGEPPTHPELLDYLARYFMDHNWSIKQLHRLIVLSNTYQQSTIGDPRLAIADAENRLLARQNRRRLDFEQLRDSLLFAAGRLDPAPGGPGVDLTSPNTRRRTVYGFIERQNLPGMFRTFDFANPDTSSPQRYTTTVPQQSLFLMNSPFVVEQARHLAARTASLPTKDRIERMYALCYGRKPDGEELSLGTAFIDAAAQESKTLAVWEKYAQVLLLSNEFAFVD